MATNNADNFTNPVAVANGGSGAASETAYAVLCGGTTSTGPIQPIASVGTSTQVLISNGAGALPTFQTPAGGGTPVSIGAVTNNWYPSGSYFNGTSSNGNSTNNISTGTLYFHPFFVSKTSVYKAIGVFVNTTGGGNVVLGLYNDNGNSAPTGSPIANSNSGALNTSAGGTFSFTFGATISLSAGIYWCAFTCDADTLIFGPTVPTPNTELSGRGLGLSGTPSAANIVKPQAGWSQSFAYNTTLPSVGSLTAIKSGDVGDCYVILQAN